MDAACQMIHRESKQNSFQSDVFPVGSSLLNCDPYEFGLGYPLVISLLEIVIISFVSFVVRRKIIR